MRFIHQDSKSVVSFLIFLNKKKEKNDIGDRVVKRDQLHPIRKEFRGIAYKMSFIHQGLQEAQSVGQNTFLREKNCLNYRTFQQVLG